MADIRRQQTADAAILSLKGNPAQNRYIYFVGLLFASLVTAYDRVPSLVEWKDDDTHTDQPE
jgi:hypothetical protein